MNKTDRLYGVICIDESLNDTLISFRVNLESDEADIHLSDKIDFGVSINFKDEEQSKFYDVELYKLKMSVSGDYHKTLKNNSSFAPSGMNQLIIENFANSILLVHQMEDGTLLTTDDQGSGELIANAIFNMNWFPKFKDHDYTVVEYYQDSKRSWVHSYVKK